MSVKRGMRRISIVINVFIWVLIVFGAWSTYAGYRAVENLNRSLALYYPDPNEQIPNLSTSIVDRVQVIRNREGLTKYVPSPETSRNEVLYGISDARSFRNFGLIVLGLSGMLWVLRWIIEGFIPED